MAKKVTNKELVRLLREVAAAMEVRDEGRFRIIAYENAASGIEKLNREIVSMWEEKKLKEVEGIGPNIASHIEELILTRRVKHFDQIKKGLPPAMFEFINIPGIGAKTAFKLAKELKINNSASAISELKIAASQGKIRKIVGFGEKSEADIYQGILVSEKNKSDKKRMLLSTADEIAREIIDYLKKSPIVMEADALGSLRRMVSTIGDIDISIKTLNPKEAIDWIVKYPRLKKVLERGEESLVRILVDNDVHVDFRLQEPDSYGAMLQYFTGGKSHNVSLRVLAQKKEISLSEYGIKTKGRLLKFENEIEFYNKLGMDWIPPELREDTGEINAAINHELPNLVEVNDIKGDLHVHSNFQIETSHDKGNNSFEDLLMKGQEMGYEYLGFSEHNPSVSKHSDSEIVDILKRKKEMIERINNSNDNRVSKFYIKAFNCLEIDIKQDGELALPEKALESLDFAIASIHSSFGLSRDKMTKRVLKGMAHPKVKILGHPTGRLLEEREGYDLDWDKLFEFCLNNNKWLEINSWPHRLDLPDSLVKQAVRAGVKITINTDSHDLSQMDLIKYGVSVARRGWAQKSDIINTLGYVEFKKMMKMKGGETN